jgi:hypothetical protein
LGNVVKDRAATRITINERAVCIRPEECGMKNGSAHGSAGPLISVDRFLH